MELLNNWHFLLLIVIIFSWKETTALRKEVKELRLKLFPDEVPAEKKKGWFIFILFWTIIITAAFFFAAIQYWS